jgi:hypothetical protein
MTKIKIKKENGDKIQDKPKMHADNSDVVLLIKRAAHLYVETGGIIPPADLDSIEKMESANSLDVNVVAEEDIADPFDYLLINVNEKIKKIKKDMERYHRDKQSGAQSDTDVMNTKMGIRKMIQLVRENDLTKMEKLQQDDETVGKNLFSFKKQSNKEPLDAKLKERQNAVEAIKLSLEWCARNLENSGGGAREALLGTAAAERGRKANKRDESADDCPEIDITASYQKLQAMKLKHEQMLGEFRDNLIELGEINKGLSEQADKKNSLLRQVISKTDEQNAKLDDLNKGLVAATEATHSSGRAMMIVLGIAIVLILIMVGAFLVSSTINNNTVEE